MMLQSRTKPVSGKVGFAAVVPILICLHLSSNKASFAGNQTIYARQGNGGGWNKKEAITLHLGNGPA